MKSKNNYLQSEFVFIMDCKTMRLQRIKAPHYDSIKKMYELIRYGCYRYLLN